MRITVCELPHDPLALEVAWAGLCRHTRENSSELVLLPEFAMVQPLWESEQFDAARWSTAEALTGAWVERFGELGAPRVVATRPATTRGRRYNEGYLWSAGGGLKPLRRKYFLPTEPGNWESSWFEKGDPDFAEFQDGTLCFGLNICTELWALETYSSYAKGKVQVIMSPRATAASTTAKWLSAGVVAAARSGAFSVSSNRVDPTGACGGVGWIISPDGRILATTGPGEPFSTVDIDLAAPLAAKHSYPRYIFNGE